MSNHTPKQATPKGLLLKELIGQNTPMSEREWAAAEEIIRLQDQNKALLEALIELVDLVDGIRAGSDTPDSFTTQPARAVIAKAKGQTE